MPSGEKGLSSLLKLADLSFTTLEKLLLSINSFSFSSIFKK